MTARKLSPSVWQLTNDKEKSNECIFNHAGGFTDQGGYTPDNLVAGEFPAVQRIETITGGAVIHAVLSWAVSCIRFMS